MKKIISIIILIVITTTLCSCENNKTTSNKNNNKNNFELTTKQETTKEETTQQETLEIEKLYTPELHVNNDKTLIYWQPQENADYYILSIGDKEFIVRDTKFDYSIMPDGYYKVSIISQKNNMNNCEVVPRDQEVSIRVKSIDYEEIINTVSTSTIKANVTIKVKQYNTLFGFETESVQGQGSGVIYRRYTETNGEYTYYVLTNYHVVEKNKDYKKIEITIEDYQGQIYEADKRQTNYNQDYDLSVLNFTTSKELNFIEMANKNPEPNEKVISIGQPKGQTNSITIGECLRYTKINLTTGVAPNFDVIEHNSPTNNGSSGGAIIDIDQKLVGINFAGHYDENKNFIKGYGIPIEKIKEYLQKNNFKY